MLNVIEKERPEGIIVQFGGQTPLKLATALEKALKDNPIPAASGEGRGACMGGTDSVRAQSRGLRPCRRYNTCFSRCLLTLADAA